MGITSYYWNIIFICVPFFSPPVLMHGGLLGVAFCPSVCLSARLGLDQNSLGKKSLTRKKIISLYEDDHR